MKSYTYKHAKDPDTMTPAELETELKQAKIPAKYARALSVMQYQEGIVDRLAKTFLFLMIFSFTASLTVFFLVAGNAVDQCDSGVRINGISSLVSLMITSIFIAGWAMCYLQLIGGERKHYEWLVEGIFHSQQRTYTLMQVRHANKNVSGQETLKEYTKAVLMAPLAVFRPASLIGLSISILAFFLLPTDCV